MFGHELTMREQHTPFAHTAQSDAFCFRAVIECCAQFFYIILFTDRRPANRSYIDYHM